MIFLGWPAKYPRASSIIIYVFVVAIIVLIVLLLLKYVTFGKAAFESYGMPGKGGGTIDSVGAGQPFFQESFASPNPLELAPSTSFIFDGQDAIGFYRVGRSGAKYYVVKDSQGNVVKDNDGYVMYVQQVVGEPGAGGLNSALDTLRLNFNDPAVRNDYETKCQAEIKQSENERDIRGKVTGYSDPWGWMTAQARAQGEGFSVAAQDALLSQKAQGL